jgi:hypothetical protein
MEDEKSEFLGDSPWQSVRLGFGAVLLILSGLGLFLADSNIHLSTALTTITESR